MKIAINTLLFIVKVLPKKQKIKLIGVGILLLINTFLELIGLGALLPVFSVLLEENVVEKYSWAAFVYELFGLSHEKQLIIALTIGLLLVIILKNVLGLWISYFNSAFALTLYKDFALRLHEYYYRKGFAFFKINNSNLLARNLKTATKYFSKLQVLGSLNLVNEVIVLFFIITFLALYNLKILGLLIVTVVPPFYLFYRWVRLRSLELGEIQNRMEPIIGKNIFQSIYGYVDVIIAGAEKTFRKEINKNLDELVDVEIKSTVYNLAPTRVIESSLVFAIVVIVVFGIYFLPSKIELLKILGLFAVAGYRIMPSINRMMIAINGLNQSRWVFGILEPLKEHRTIKEDEINQDLNFNHHLQIENLQFNYPGSSEIILDNFNLTITKGEIVGLVGPSGAGKTTLMNILLGFLKPTKGKYLIDGVNLKDEYLKSFYKKIGYVQQQVYLIDGTIAENVALGCLKTEMDQAKVREVLKKASLWETVENFPNSINEMIGENGTKLSGGQRQRVGIARALYFDAEILFFDEATSALDSQTEEEITEAINSLSDGNLTFIIIAHRKSTLKYCNRIIEINNHVKSLVS